MTKDIKYIIKRVIIGVLISIILMYIGSLKVKADTICIQDTWRNSAYDSTIADNYVWASYNRNLAVCGDYVNIMIPAIIQNASSNLYSANAESSTFQLILNNGMYYFGKLENGYIIWENVLTKQNNVELYITGLRYSTVMYDNSNIYIYPFIQVYSVNSENQVINSVDQVRDGVNNINNSINNTDAPPNEDLDNILNNKSNNNNVSNLVMFVPNIFASVGTGLSSNCGSSIQLGNLLGTNLTLTCIRPQNYIGSQLWTIIDFMFLFGLFLAFRKWVVNIYNDLTSLKEVKFN